MVIQAASFCSLLWWLTITPLCAGDVERLLSTRPFILEVPGFASPADCQAVLELMERCRAGESPFCTEDRSFLVDEGGSALVGEDRHSATFSFSAEGDTEAAVDELLQRAAVLARHPVAATEGVQIASYGAGDYYEFHHDSLDRRATFILYLTDVAAGEGGETIFPLVRAQDVTADAAPPLRPAMAGRVRPGLDFQVDSLEPMAPYCESDFYLKVRPEQGKALLFYSYGPDRSLDEYAVHGACPLLRGNKSIMQRWMRFEPNGGFAQAGDAIRKARIDWGLERVLHPLKLESKRQVQRTAKALSSEQLLRLMKKPEGHVPEL